MNADFYTEAWLIYLLTSAIFIILFHFLLKLFFKSFWIVYISLMTFAVGLLTPIDNSVDSINAIAPAIMVLGLSGMDNLFANTPDWSLTIKSLIFLVSALVLAQLSLIVGRLSWVRFKGQNHE
ncbi:hypothetical protein [Marinicellulosiphila megalodicopiae]|uniref:hypothetical protein n=1 Tax=Marinicellulosiphila megalodicopiae TaxID=2724896 RepID=UPI003BAEDC3A